MKAIIQERGASFHSICIVAVHNAKKPNRHGLLTIFIYSFMYMYINQIYFTPFYLENYVHSHFITICGISCHSCNDISLEEGLSALAKSYQNGENSTADNSTMTDHNGKVSIHLESSWLRLSNYIGVYRVVL
jgi:hypothetical protein